MAKPTKSKPPKHSPGKAGKLTAQQIGSLPPKPGSRPRGAPKGNNNGAGNVRHGLKGSKLPPGCKYIEHRVNALRRQCEEAVLELKGSVNIIDAAAINSILKWERHGLLAAHWLRHEIDNLSPSDRLKFSESIARASDNRDKNIRALGLDVQPKPIDLQTYLAPNDGNGK